MSDDIEWKIARSSSSGRWFVYEYVGPSYYAPRGDFSSVMEACDFVAERLADQPTAAASEAQK